MSIDSEMEEILSLFFEESFEGLDTMESGLLTLEDGADRETINNIFRAAHSIKGGAGTFGFMEISEFTHSVETLLDEMRNGARAITADALQVLLQSVDVIREMTQSAQAKQPIVMTGPNALSGELARILAQRVAPSAVADTSAAASEAPPAVPAAQSTVAPRIVQPVKRAAALTGPLEGWRIVFAPDVSLFKTCNDPMRIFDELANLGPLEVTANVDNVPNMSDLEPTQCFLSWTLLLRGAIEHARVAEVFDWVDASSKIAYEPIYGVSSSSAATDGPAADLPQSAAPRSAGASDLHAAPPSAAKSGGESGSLRVATEKVDALINLVGELVITQSMLGRFAEKYEPEDIEALRRSLAQLTRNTRELQESVMQIRMLPIGF